MPTATSAAPAASVDELVPWVDPTGASVRLAAGAREVPKPEAKPLQRSPVTVEARGSEES